VVDALTNNAWVRDVDHNMSQQVISEYLQLWDMLEHVALTQMQEDKITWLHSSNGQYSAQSAYKLQFDGMDTCSTAEIIWKTKAPPKCKFFTWFLLQNRIWTAARLQARQWPNEYFCQLCIRNLETAFHLFVECPVVRSIWERLAIWVRVRVRVRTPSLNQHPVGVLRKT
jgi:hypothetical protein